MRQLLNELPFRSILLVAILVGSLLGGSNIKANEPIECFGGPPTCTANGCRRSSDLPDSFWVCNFTGNGCPPLTACE